MLQTILQQNMFLYAMGVICLLGVISQLVLNNLYDRMIRDAQSTELPRGKFIKQFRQRFGTVRRMNSGEMNARAFIQKSLIEYQCMGMSLHSYKRIGGASFIICAALGIAGYYLSGTMNYAAQIQQNYLWGAAATCLLLAVIYGLSDVRYKERFLITELEDYLENSGISNRHQEVEVTNPVLNKGKNADPVLKETAAVKEAAREEEIPLVQKGPSLREGLFMRKSSLSEENFAFKEEPAPEEAVPRKAPKEEVAAAQSKNVTVMSRRARKQAETKAQRDKRELKENLSRLKEGVSESAAEREKEKQRNTEILKQMQPAEQERIIREVLKEFLS